MFKHYVAQHAGDINLFAIIPLIMFFLFFTGALIYIFAFDKKFFEKMKNLPLEGAENQSNQTEVKDQSHD